VLIMIFNICVALCAETSLVIILKKTDFSGICSFRPG
jgi:hypothetical protein